jgi:UDP-glucose 4-epimerase
MNVMVTGATAPLGTAIVRGLLARPDVGFVLGVGREPIGPEMDDVRFAYRMADMTRPRVVHDLVLGEARAYSIDTVVHAMQHRRATDSGAAVHAQNVRSTRELVAACARHPSIRRFVYRSYAEVYALDHVASNLLDENSAPELHPRAPQWVRDRVEADVTACAHAGSELEVTVLRCADILAPGTGSQLWDYLQSRVCLRPLGFDPMINVLSLEDAATAFVLACHAKESGVYNIAGIDTLPLSRAIAESRRAQLPVPGPLLTPLYTLRRWIAGFDFQYAMNVSRFHFGGVLDGERARRELGYVPQHPVQWPRSPWELLLSKLGEIQRAA